MAKKAEKNRFEIIGEFLRERRVAVGLSQKDLGLLVGYSGGQYIYFVEKGKIDIPRDKLKKWLKVLKIPSRTYIRMRVHAEELELSQVLGTPMRKSKSS